MPKYRYRAGHAVPGVDAQVVGTEIDRIARESGGRFTPGHVVAENSRPDAPLYGCFTWDQEAAADKCREDEARRLIRSYVIVGKDVGGREVEHIANVSVARCYDHEGPAYMPATDAMTDPDLRERVLRMAKAQLDGWVERYNHIEELEGIIAAIRDAQRAAAAPPRRRGRGPRPAPAAGAV